MDLEGLQTGLGLDKQVEGGLEWTQTYCRTTMKSLFTQHRGEDAHVQISNSLALEPAHEVPGREVLGLDEGGQIDRDRVDFEQLQPPQQHVGQPY